MAFRYAPLELSVFLAQVTGAVIFTDLPIFWRQLHAATQAQPTAAYWLPFTNFPDQLIFSLAEVPHEIYRMRTSVVLANFRAVFRYVSKLLIAAEGDIAGQFEQLANDTGVTSLVAQDFGAKECPAVFTRRLRVTIPDEGFAYAGVQCQVLTYGHEDALKTVPLALFDRTAIKTSFRIWQLFLAYDLLKRLKSICKRCPFFVALWSFSLQIG